MAESWRWREAEVDEAGDHFELRYGSAREAGWDEWLPVAFVGPPEGKEFPVRFVVGRDDESKADIVKELLSELNFYLVELEQPDRWAYLQYHAGTASNIYSSIHWAFVPKGLTDTKPAQ